MSENWTGPNGGSWRIADLVTPGTSDSWRTLGDNRQASPEAIKSKPIACEHGVPMWDGVFLSLDS